MRASGVSGELRVGHRLAARLGAWTIEPKGRLFTLRACVASRDDFWFNERPIDVALNIGGAQWLWREQPVTVDGDDIVSTLTERPLVEQKAMKVAI